MPRFYLTAVAAAVMAATVNAAEFPAFPVIEGENIVYRSDVSNGPVSSGKESWEGNGIRIRQNDHRRQRPRLPEHPRP